MKTNLTCKSFSQCNHWNPPHPLTVSCKEEKKKKNVTLFCLYSNCETVWDLSQASNKHTEQTPKEIVSPHSPLASTHSLKTVCRLKLCHRCEQILYCTFVASKVVVANRTHESELLSCWQLQWWLIQTEELWCWCQFRIFCTVRNLQCLLPSPCWLELCKKELALSFAESPEAFALKHAPPYFRVVLWIYTR